LKLHRLDDYRWEIPAEGGMRVPGLIFADHVLMKDIDQDQCLKQVANVAHLPGILVRSMAMPDVHWGYGFPIGGVAAFDLEEGVISPGGVGYDINCGVRLVTTALTQDEVQPSIRPLIEALYRDIPTGVGAHGALKLSRSEVRRVLEQGSAWVVKQGFGEPADLEHTEEGGAMAGAEAENLSERAVARGLDQVGTLGSGNHFLEIDRVERIYDAKTAEVFGLFEGQVTVFIHCGSRGLGHQVCDDFLKMMMRSKELAQMNLPDRQLASALFSSTLGQRYFSAMAAAANYAWANRQVIMHLARESFQQALGLSPARLRMNLLYDVAHNIAKVETHLVDGRQRRVLVHRKGATRAFPAGHPAVPPAYRAVGQPVIIPGDMGRGSYVLAGEPGAMTESFGSSCHGAGRVLSRKAAKAKARGRSLIEELSQAGVEIRFTGRSTVAEEMPEAYKDVDRVVEVVHQAGLARKVARLKPMAVIKG
jgi:tRNA-splicing ligase RtcB